MHGHTEIRNISRYFILLLLLYEICNHANAQDNRTKEHTITLGVLVPWTGNWAEGPKFASAATIAVEDVNNDTDLLQNYTLNFVWVDDKCSGSESVGKTADLYYNYTTGNRQGVDGYIGPYCSEGCLAGGALAAYLNKPMISYSCSSNKLTNKGHYPTFARTKPFVRQDGKGLGKKLVALMKTNEWEYITLLVSKQQAWHDFGQVVFENMHNVKVDKIQFDPQTKNWKPILTRAKESARIFALFGYFTNTSRILVEARRLGMFNGDFVFITVDFRVRDSFRKADWMKGYTLEQAFTGFLDFDVQKQSTSDSSSYMNFREQVKIRMADPPFNHAMPAKVDDDSAFLYDAIMLYAKAFQKCLNQGEDPYNGKVLMKHIFDTQYEGQSGTVLLDEKGDRKPFFELRNYQRGESKLICTYNRSTDICKPASKPPVKIVWPGGRTDPPEGRPQCGFDGELCKGPRDGKENTLIQILAIIFGIVFIVIALTVAYVYRRKKFEKDLLAEGFFVNYEEIVNNGNYGGQNGRAGGSISSRVAVITGLLISPTVRPHSRLLRGSHPESYSIQSDTESLMERSQFIVSYRGEHVMIKRLNRTTANINRDILLEFKQVREIHHVNVCQVVGVCVTVPNVCILTQYSSKGSLQDVLQNSDIKLDWMFKMSFSSDIAAGVNELHRSGIVHGRLHSNNCVIDNRWVCKITDYGMDKFKQTHSNNNEDETEYQRYRKLLWQAPELLKGDSNGCNGGNKTKEGDTYSYGIILSEIITREDPYASYEMEPKEIVSQVRARLDPPFRPKISESECDIRFINLMRACWHDCPTQRPNFETIKNRLKRLFGGRTGNLMDNMIAMMEKYTNNLEELVDERTEQLAAEKEKTDELLYKMLPKTIAEQLKDGQQVTAESFDSVTIFFSDIVGFTSLASMSTPMQVVDLLNDLYTCFDKCIDIHDVYKVETIGDAYMVVSGLPQKNANRHAGEIATMSLDLLHHTKSFKIRHQQEKCLQLRIGIHSGSCVAGVVGLKMPRYCLFGDTVNYASRMESSGLALRVHVSPECKTLLDALGGYSLEDRGPTNMKGKGVINTYFLIGKKGFNKSLPDLCNAAGLDQHVFK